MIPIQRPHRYTVPLLVHHTETWRLDGHVRTGTQALGFSNEIVAKTTCLTVHWFRFEFEFEAASYEFKVLGEHADAISPTTQLTIMIDPADLSQCWLNGHILQLHPWEPDEV
jgi:hypothetical protein